MPLQTLFRRGVPYHEYHSFRQEFAKHERNWCADQDALQINAKEYFPNCAILARVPAQKALE